MTTTPEPRAGEYPLQETSPTEPNWNDPDVPAGNAPPLPRGRLVLAAVAFGLWICFLIAMAWLRVKTTPR